MIGKNLNPNSAHSDSSQALQAWLQTLKGELGNLGLIVVDHGSRRAESNDMLERIVNELRGESPIAIIEPAHMELAEPSIATAYDACVARGATLIVLHPYFLLPGRHWNEDIPRLAADAARKHPATRHLVTAPLGLHALMRQVIHARVFAMPPTRVGDDRRLRTLRCRSPQMRAATRNNVGGFDRHPNTRSVGSLPHIQAHERSNWTPPDVQPRPRPRLPHRA